MLGLIVNLTAASIRISFARLKREPLTPEYIRAMDAYTELPIADAPTARKAAELFRLPVTADSMPAEGIRHATGKWSFLPGVIFRAGLALTLIGLLLSAHTRRSSDIVLHDGERRETNGTVVHLTSIKADLPADHLQVGEDGTLLLEGVSARLAVNNTSAVVTPGFPTRIKGAWYRIRHLGYSQEMTVTLRGRQRSFTADLDLLPPGRSSVVPLPPGTASLSYTLDPDRTIEKGLLKGRQYNLAQPSYRVRYSEGRRQEDGKGMRMRPGDRVVVGPSTVTLGKQGLAMRLQVVSDPGLPLVYGGAIILLTGLGAMLSRFFWYERECALIAKDGMLLVGSRDEFFKKWGIHRFHGCREKLDGQILL
jgi:hypothetical protein